MKSPTGREWSDPSKKPASVETMNTPGDFGRFTDLMRKIVAKVEKPRPASHETAAS